MPDDDGADQPRLTSIRSEDRSCEMGMNSAAQHRTAARQNVLAVSRWSAFSRARSLLNTSSSICVEVRQVAFAFANQAQIFLEVNSYKNISQTHHTRRFRSGYSSCSMQEARPAGRSMDRRAEGARRAPDHAILGGAHHGSRDSSASTRRCIIVR
ncbi:hypothetical protein PVAP13_4KG180333 [Panicum virgatum]|uniref:Uncharacterized protein n=1 Tax=Panicum virgatum TaxID=38727 RepID=A0A8T0TMQ8_PANVG|nr:hypothetical protein PVAP13_4KG180333 [Panicum virgatum]